ncbi:MAG: hypothetical protein R3F33_16085 [Planctomycetota bacterium]
MQYRPLFAALFLCTAPLQAQNLRVALAAGNVTQCGIDDVRDKLLATGRFQAVDVLDVVSSTPDLATMQGYQAIMTWTNQDYFDRVTLGDRLADYVDWGGGVVVATFGNAAGIGGRYIGGRWLAGGYEVIDSQSNFVSDPATLGTILAPGHPLMVGVSNLSASYAARPTTTNLVQGLTIAQWSDGRILAAVGDMPGRVDIGLFPPSSDCIGVYWNSAGDGTTLMANALEYVTSGGANFTTFCDPADPNSTGQPTHLLATLSGAAGSGLHLNANAGPAGQFTYLLVGSAAADPGLALSQGHLCLGTGAGAQLGRYNVIGGELNSVGIFDSNGVWTNLVGTSATGSGFDVPQALPLIGSPTIAAGETWYFQLWFREAGGASNFSNGVGYTF